MALRGAGRQALAAAWLAALAPCPLLAQEAAPLDPAEMVTHAEDPRIFVPQDFAAFAPRTALDMVRQIPGFSIDGGFGGGGNNNNNTANTARGLGQASGNVLLNGVRIVTKAGSISDELARIPADSVVRIELVEGSTLNIPGLSGRVANVIAESVNGLQGQFEWRPQFGARYADDRWAEGIVSLTGTSGALDWTVALEGRPVRNGNAGPNVVTFGDGSFDTRFNEFGSHGDDKRASTAVSYTTHGGTLLNFNASYLLRRFKSFEYEFVTGPAGTPPLTDDFDQRNRGHDREVGGDIDFALAGGRLKLIVLDSSARLDVTSQTVIDPADGTAPFGSRFNLASTKGERIGRSEYSWAMLGGDWQWSVEGAFNRLDQVGELARLSGGSFVPLPFPAGTGGVREERYESLVSYGRPLAPGWTMQLILGGEYSNIRQTGTDPRARTFVRPKGSLTIGWVPGPRWNISFKIEQRVGQLNFADFLAAVNLNDNNQNATNNDLRPDQSLGGEVRVAHDFGAWGSLTVRGFYRRFQDYITIIPTANGGEARGNVPWSRIMGLDITGTLQLAPLGVPGAKIDFQLDRRSSRFPDPVEPGFLPVQFAQPRGAEIDFRYDIPGSDWALGAEYKYQTAHPYYRVAEYGHERFFRHNPGFFIEHKDVFGLTAQFRLSNLLDRPLGLDRYVFTGPRGSSPLLFSEHRRRYVGPVANVTIKGSF
ncbi:TonB-dependent receptor plug domain-containing protein [Alteraurantiacibacter buctensis]|uniref:TonB-dependent receptor plug domain-containing protein n=1 Tax=Alteraurantiacibacter buctensis TaxID=1503981 RepID=A0A844Z1T4_9SPHN|nr:TonB-dependent receptor plug domain-containing protein [Alteraurantiacibacter buctensis]MXO73308.1 TonB-dependent receptor plug domain-containing protein [Alteraurantiacibacter buctensis]